MSYIGHLLPDARQQLRFHMVMSMLWIAAMIGTPFLHTFQGIQNVGALLIMEVSLYANFATEFGSIAAAQAAIQTKGK